MTPEIAVPAVVEVVGQLRRYLMQRQFSAYDAVPYRFDGHAMVRLLQNVEQESLLLMQQRTAQILAALELGVSVFRSTGSTAETSQQCVGFG